VRAIFMGTPAIAVPALDALTRVAEVVGVVCQPDRPSGRGLAVHAPPVKERALSLGLTVTQPAKIRTPEFLSWMRERDADVAVVLAYGRILPPDVLALPRRGCLNLHASILPRYRGAAPINWAIVRGETETGMSLMQMEAGLDTGPVFGIRKIDIGENEAAGELAARLAELGATTVTEDVPRVVAGELGATPQNEAEATLAPLLRKEDGRIDWTGSAKSVHDHVRGMSPWPGAFTMAGPKRLLVAETRRSPFQPSGAAPGTVISADTAGVLVATSAGAIEITKGQLEGRKVVSGHELVSGRAITLGMRLG
jgi:methionyl-tRNA formyltransferase